MQSLIIKKNLILIKTMILMFLEGQKVHIE